VRAGVAGRLAVGLGGELLVEPACDADGVVGGGRGGSAEALDGLVGDAEGLADPDAFGPEMVAEGFLGAGEGGGDGEEDKVLELAAFEDAGDEACELVGFETAGGEVEAAELGEEVVDAEVLDGLDRADAASG
jgi:hypothetical protein